MFEFNSSLFSTMCQQNKCFDRNLTSKYWICFHNTFTHVLSPLEFVSGKQALKSKHTMGETGKSADLICVPGQRLCLSDGSTVSGEGTYERQGYIYSLLAGVVDISQKDKVRKLVHL